VEELDTDDDNPQGVGLDQGYGPKRFVSDELRFTGIDLGGGDVRRRRSGDAHDDDFTPSDDEDDYDVPSDLVRQPDMQLIYKDKEDMLVERALERIARARALERNQNPPRPSAVPKDAPKSKKEAPVKRRPVEVRKKPSKNDNKSASNSPKGKTVDGRSRGRSSASNNAGRDSRDNSVASYTLPPADPDYGRRPPYPQPYYASGPRQAESSRQGSRTNSNQSLRQQQVQQLGAFQHIHYASRHPSNPEVVYGIRSGSNPSRAPRPDPSEPEWEPRTRSSSSLVNVPLDQLPYQTNTGRAPRFDPSDPRFASPQRRVASGPPAVYHNQAPQYRRPQDELFLPDEEPEVMRYLAPSDSEDDDDSDYDEGVQVDVSERPGGDYAIQTRSSTTTASAQKTGNTGNKGRSGKGKKRR